MDLDLLGGSLNPKNLIDLAKFKYKFKKDNPDYFYPEGLLVFCGTQGSRKNFVSCSVCKETLY